jgi:hypothetical protein
MDKKKASMSSPEYWYRLRKRMQLVAFWKLIERKWEKYENAIQIIFVLDGIVFSIAFPSAITQGENMNSIFGILVSASLWILVISAILLVRNSGKVSKQKQDETNQLLRDLIKKIEERWPK